MNSNNRFDWIAYYQEFAVKLLEYKNNRNELIKIVERVFKNIEIPLAKLETNNEVVDIDPFTVFGLFNKSSMKEENRKKIITEFSKQLNISSKTPQTFDSIPILNNQNATFYQFKNQRDETQIDALWDFFETALEYAINKNNDTLNKLEQLFDLCIGISGNANGKITMGLYWIAPYSYLNLDRVNASYIKHLESISSDLKSSIFKSDKKISGKDYFILLKAVEDYINNDSNDTNNFVDFSYEAYKFSQKEKLSNKLEESLIEDTSIKKYWLYSANINYHMWNEIYENGIIAIGWEQIGDLKQYKNKKEFEDAMKNKINPDSSNMNGVHATWQFVYDMKPGDIVYVKKGVHEIIGRGEVLSDYEYNNKDYPYYPNTRKINWTHKGSWPHPGKAAIKTLTDITEYPEYIKELQEIFDNDDLNSKQITYTSYLKEDFLSEVYIDENEYDTLIELLKMKKNLILQGAPGVGKTFAAKRLAYAMMSEKSSDRIMMIQFHQSYSYEDLIEGYRPCENGFINKKGPLYNFCKKAKDDSENDYFFIIDEINRGNLSKIFGELLMLIENDKRDKELHLLYSHEKFSVPSNLYIIGMMNTADRSLALLDYALRRRFAFYEMKPGFKSDGFKKYLSSFNNDKFNLLIKKIEELNKVIKEDESLGHGFCIGHSYFCNLNEVNDKVLSNIIEYEIIPLLREYWFDEESKVNEWTSILRGVIK